MLALPGFRNHVVPIDEVPTLVARYGADECYASIFCFSEDILLYLAEQRVDGRPSVAGYDGKVWAPFLPLDIDAKSPSAWRRPFGWRVTRRRKHASCWSNGISANASIFPCVSLAPSRGPHTHGRTRTPMVVTTK